MFYEGNPKARFIKRPALDENDESNFNYPYGVGYSTETLHEQREVMDDASWRALFMNEPIEREGQLYPEEELRRYFDLPDGEPEAVIAVCDTKDKGEDYCVLPIAYKYGDDYYIEGVVCDNSAPSVVETRLVMALMKHNVQLAQFESNSAGGKVAEKVQSEIKAKKGNTKIVTKYTTSNKETKIIVNSPFIKEHCLFKDNSVIKDDKEYRLFLRQLTGYTMAGKNKHDDVPDAMAQLALYCQSFGLGKVQVLKRFF
jgi:predicted phage terminase large subunit-like protein